MIKDSKYYVLVLSPGGLDSCVSGRAGARGRLAEDIRKVTTFNGVRWVHDYQEACLGKLERFIKGEQLRLESPFCQKKSGRDSGRSTPNISSPLLIQKFLKNRAISIESNLCSQST